MNPNADTIFTPDKDFKELEKAYAHIFNGLIDAQKEAAGLRMDKAALFAENVRLNDWLAEAREGRDKQAELAVKYFDEVVSLQREVAAGDIALKCFIRAVIHLGADAENAARESLMKAREAGEF